MQLRPPLEHARVNWISHLHEWLGVICDQPRLQASRYDQAIARKREVAPKTFRDLVREQKFFFASVSVYVRRFPFVLLSYVSLLTCSMWWL